MNTDITHFLLIEDNEDHALLVRETFDEHRLSNTLAHVDRGELGLAYLRNEGEYEKEPRPDVVLLDLNLPDKHGLEILSEMKGDPTLQTIPVVILTTSNNDSDRAEAYRRHANSYVQKPVGFDQLEEIVSQLELYWTICNRPPVHPKE